MLQSQRLGITPGTMELRRSVSRELLSDELPPAAHASRAAGSSVAGTSSADAGPPTSCFGVAGLGRKVDDGSHSEDDSYETASESDWDMRELRMVGSYHRCTAACHSLSWYNKPAQPHTAPLLSSDAFLARYCLCISSSVLLTRGSVLLEFWKGLCLYTRIPQGEP
jgi:hypothetical protein